MVIESGGIALIIREVKSRRSRSSRLKESKDNEEVDKLAIIFREDIVILKIQIAVRVWLRRLKMKPAF